MWTLCPAAIRRVANAKMAHCTLRSAPACSEIVSGANRTSLEDAFKFGQLIDLSCRLADTLR